MHTRRLFSPADKSRNLRLSPINHEANYLSIESLTENYFDEYYVPNIMRLVGYDNSTLDLLKILDTLTFEDLNERLNSLCNDNNPETNDTIRAIFRVLHRALNGTTTDSNDIFRQMGKAFPKMNMHSLNGLIADNVKDLLAKQVAVIEDQLAPNRTPSPKF